MFEGDHCDDFVPTATPDIEEGCFQTNRMPPRHAMFEFQFQPTAQGERRCDVVVTGDTDGEDVLRMPLYGRGVATDETTDVRIMGDVNRRDDQTWDLSRPAVADTIQVSWLLEADAEAGQEEQSGMPPFMAVRVRDGRTNKIRIAARDLPPKGAEITIVYDRWCYERQ